MSDGCISVAVPGFLADGTTPDGDGIVWTVQKIDGWFDSASVRVSLAEVLPVGQVVTTVREQSRAIVFQLLAHAPATTGTVATDPLGKTLCFTAMDSIEAPFACVYAPVVFEVTDPIPLTLHASVRRVGAIQKRIVGESAAVRFQIALTAEDPMRYDSLDQPYD